MDKYIWGTREWPNSVKYYHEIEDSYYCTNWAIYMFKEGEWVKIGNTDITRQLLNLWASIIEELQGYIHLKTFCYDINFKH